MNIPCKRNCRSDFFFFRFRSQLLRFVDKNERESKFGQSLKLLRVARNLGREKTKKSTKNWFLRGREETEQSPDIKSRNFGSEEEKKMKLFPRKIKLDQNGKEKKRIFRGPFWFLAGFRRIKREQ